MHSKKTHWPSSATGLFLRVFVAFACVFAVASASASEISDLEHYQGLTVVEGDILTGPRLTMRGVGLSGGNRPWRDGIVPFVIDDKLEPESVIRVEQAVAHWNEVSGISLRAVSEDHAQTIDHVRFRSGPGCASWVGRQGGEQEIWIAPSCTAGSIMHEIGHALGLEHEHIRADRDQYVQIQWENIDPEKRHNFDLAPAGSQVYGEYDYASIMHYGTSNFSINGAPTIVPLDGVEVSIGQRIAPSPGDLSAIATRYQSDLALFHENHVQSDGAEIVFRVDNLHMQGAHQLSLSFKLSDPSAEWFSDSPWQCQRQGMNWACSLDRLNPGASSFLSITHSNQQELSNLAAGIVSKTPDLDPSNNGVQPVNDSQALPDQSHLLAGARQSFQDAPSGSDGSIYQDSLAGGAGAMQMFALLMLAAFVSLRQFSKLTVSKDAASSLFEKTWGAHFS